MSGVVLSAGDESSAWAAVLTLLSLGLPRTGLLQGCPLLCSRTGPEGGVLFHIPALQAKLLHPPCGLLGHLVIPMVVDFPSWVRLTWLTKRLSVAGGIFSPFHLTEGGRLSSVLFGRPEVGLFRPISVR